MATNSLISIIVPVYNCEKLIEKCINSLISQTYKNIEIIIVDDGSSDKSGEICDRLAEKYNFIKVIHQENHGVGVARNVGIDAANGDYITFVDSDDLTEPEMIEEFYASSQKYNSDIVFDGLKYCDKDYNVYRTEMIQVPEGCYYEEDIYKKIILPLISFGPCEPFKKPANPGNCTCLFKSKLIENIRFEDNKTLPIAEDLVFLLYALKNSKTVSKTNGCRYIYYAPFDADSRSRGKSSISLEKRVSVIPSLKKFAEIFYKNSNDPIYDFICAKYVREATRCMFINSLSKNGVKNTYKSVKGYLNLTDYQNAVSKIYGKQNSFKDKMLMFFIKHKTALLLTLYIFIKWRAFN